VVILHLGRSAYYDTDRIGADIWQRLQQPVRVRDLCQAIQAEYDVALSVCQEDVLAFLEDARREGLIRIMPAV
jgi:hypothetical protein